ncbi:MAG: hypothetical protein IJB98_00335, partial [Clostridia bacterium]|nr:hypothetical protein [Clostridia bacterium]
EELTARPNTTCLFANVKLLLSRTKKKTPRVTPVRTITIRAIKIDSVNALFFFVVANMSLPLLVTTYSMFNRGNKYI